MNNWPINDVQIRSVAVFFLCSPIHLYHIILLFTPVVLEVIVAEEEKKTEISCKKYELKINNRIYFEIFKDYYNSSISLNTFQLFQMIIPSFLNKNRNLEKNQKYNFFSISLFADNILILFTSFFFLFNRIPWKPDFQRLIQNLKNESKLAQCSYVDSLYFLPLNRTSLSF